MFCRYCGHEQDDGAFCDKCGKPLGGAVQLTVDEQTAADDYYQSVDDTAEQPEIKRSKAPIIAAAAVCAVAVGMGLLFVLISGRDKVKTDDSEDTKPAVTTVKNDDQGNDDSQEDIITKADEDESVEEAVTTTAATTTTTTATAATTSADATTTTAAPEPEKVEIIPATELIEMSIPDIIEAVGDDWRVSWEEYSNEYGGYKGIVSDKHFPNVLITFPYTHFDDEEALREAFERAGADTSFFDITVFDGGLIGDGVKVGDSYHDMMTKVDALGGIQVDNELGSAIIDNHRVELVYSGTSDILSIKRRLSTSVVDGYDTDYVCTKASLTQQNFGTAMYYKGTVTGDGVALRVAPYTDAANLWNISKGETVYVTAKDSYIECDGSLWYEVAEYRTDSGVWKIGYIHAEYVDVD